MTEPVVSEDKAPKVRFDESLARPIFPKPELKHAVLVRIPYTEDHKVIPTFIRPEWGGSQVFFGSYYAIVGDEGEVRYGSAKLQWEAMHGLIRPGYWVKTKIPMGYRASERCRIITLVPDEGGVVREADVDLVPGDWIVRQPGGEMQHIKASKYGEGYYAHDEAQELGLFKMSAQEFAEWALEQACSGMPR